MRRTQSALIERLRAEQANRFVAAAMQSITAGHSWAHFLKRRPEYGIFPEIRQRRHDEYKAMQKRCRQSGAWNIRHELKIARKSLQAAQGASDKGVEEHEPETGADVKPMGREGHQNPVQ